MEINIGIDASRNRSGGAISHLIEILRLLDPYKYNISKIYVWSYRSLLDILPDYPWLIKCYTKYLEKSLLHQLFWQRFLLPRIAKKNGCKAILNTDAGTILRFKPAITMSCDMLPFDKDAQRKYPFGLAKLRIMVLKFISIRSLEYADGVIFLNDYAAKKIKGYLRRVNSYKIIPHGIGDEFKNLKIRDYGNKKGYYRCLYISSFEPYKNHINVIKAINYLRVNGIDVRLRLIGDGKGRFSRSVLKYIHLLDPKKEFINNIGYVPRYFIPNYIVDADIFIFASSCENMPNILLEGMAAGAPIACSNIRPMPDILKDAGIYFNPDDFESIAEAVRELIISEEKRANLGKRAKEIANEYSWKKCADDTLKYITDIIRMNNIRKES